MPEPRIPARESGRLLLIQACEPTGRPVGEGQIKKRDKLKWRDRSVKASPVREGYRKPAPEWARDIWGGSA